MSTLRFRNPFSRRRVASKTEGQKGSAALSVSALFMLLMVALATIGVAYGLWFKLLRIDVTVHTGNVHALFTEAFTDDDDKVDLQAKDSQDTDSCVDFGNVDDFTPEDANPNKGFTSCDPAASGRDPKPHHEKDVAACVARITTNPNVAEVTKYNVYPGYFCTAWFDVKNDGTIPVRIQSVRVNGQSVIPSRPTPFDLDGDERPDVAIHVTGLQTCQQIEPGETIQMDIDQQVLQTAQQRTTLRYNVQVQLNQYNEACRVLLYHGNGGFSPADEAGPSGDLFGLKARYEAAVFAVDYTDVFPADLSIYRLVILYGPGSDPPGFGDDLPANFFSAAQKAALSAYMVGGGRVVVMGDHSGEFGQATVNDLLAGLGVGITQNADVATPDGDACAPLTDITPDQVTAGIASLDPSATSSLSGGTSLARVDPAPYTCFGGVINGATWMAVGQVAGAPPRPGGDLIVISDLNILDDLFGFGDPAGDGMSGPALADNLVGY